MDRNDDCINQDYGVATQMLMRPCASDINLDLEVAQLKVFPFESKDQRMTVISKVKGADNLLVLMKGAPEVLVQKCDPASGNW